jgi:hypothetical protein
MRIVVFQFLDAFAKLRKATIGFVMSVRLPVHPSVRMEQLDPKRMVFHEILYLSIFRKNCRENSSFINI